MSSEDVLRNAGCFVVGGYEIDASTLEVRDPSGSTTEVAPGVIELLVYLASHRARVVTKVELIERLWPGVTVNDNALAQYIWAARKAVGDAGSEQRVIKNVRGRGYRWVAEVAERRREVPSSSSAPADGAARFVGRQAELDRLAQSLKEGLRGEGRICLVAGEPGIGKTRLLQELRVLARSEGYHDSEGRCHEDDAMPPFWPWKQALGQIERSLDDATLKRAVSTEGADLSRLMGNLPLRLAAPAPAPPREADDDRYYLFQAVSEFLSRAGAEQPQLVLLDDIHWADLASLALLKFLATHVGAARVVVVCAYRSNELSPPREALLRSMGKSARVSSQVLAGLDLRSIAAILQKRGVEEDTAFLERVMLLTRGNPLFVAELGRIPADALYVGEATTSLALDRVLTRRLSLLDPQIRVGVAAAAVLGHDFRLADLRRCTGEPVEEIARWIAALVDQQIVLPDPEETGVYRFAHPLLRDVAYRSLDDATRAQQHRAVAVALENAAAEGWSARIDELAHHYFAAIASGTAAKAAHYARRVAERAFQAAAFEESVRLFKRGLAALELADTPDELERDILLLGLGHALRGAAEPPDVVRAPFARVAERAARTQNAALFAAAALGYAGNGSVRLYHLTEMGVVDHEETDYLMRADAMLGPSDSEQKALVLALLARSLYHAADWQQRDAIARSSVAMARRVADPRLLARVLLLKQQVLRTPDALHERIADLSEAIAFADSIGARELQIDARHERAWAFMELAQVENAEQDILRIGRLADELQQKSERRLVELWRLARAYVSENVDDVEARDLARTKVRKSAHGSQAYGVRLLMARYFQGRAAETIPLLEGFAQNLPLSGSWNCALASTYATVGRLEDAARELEKIAAGGYAAVPRTHDWLASFAFLANAAQLIGSKKRGAELRAILTPFAANVVVIGVGSYIGGLVSRVLGDLNRLLGDVTEAERCYERALALAARLGSPVLAAWTHTDLAELYLTSEKCESRTRAVELLGAVLPDIERLGLGLFRNRVHNLVERYSLSPVVPVSSRVASALGSRVSGREA